jgi:hypothetical protein
MTGRSHRDRDVGIGALDSAAELRLASHRERIERLLRERTLEVAARALRASRASEADTSGGVPLVQPARPATPRRPCPDSTPATRPT